MPSIEVVGICRVEKAVKNMRRNSFFTRLRHHRRDLGQANGHQFLGVPLQIVSTNSKNLSVDQSVSTDPLND